MTLSLSLSDINTRIYAVTALASLSPDSRIVLLHPDHSEALKLVARDSIAAIVASLPKGLVTGTNYSSDTVSLNVFNDDIDSEIATAAFLYATTMLTIAQVKLAAAGDTAAVVSLASALPSVTSSLAEILAPIPKAARIIPAL